MNLSKPTTPPHHSTMMWRILLLCAALQASGDCICYGWTFYSRENLLHFGLGQPMRRTLVCNERNTNIGMQQQMAQHGCSNDRRRIMGSTVASAIWLVSKSTAAAEDVPQFSIGLLDSRVTENVLSPPPYGMESNDIYYPSWFAGTWNVRSVCTEVAAPCDIPLFGGEAKFQSAQREVGKPVKYQSRFLLQDGGETVADREFNVVSIAKATMGNASVVNVSESTPNRLSVLLAIGESGGLVQADLLTLNRRQERVQDSQFDCAEAVQEVVSAPTGTSKGIPQPTGPKILKQIETASLYKRNPDGSISCRQRSATFLLPSQQDPVALRLWQISRGRPIDVRFYDVEYSKVN